MKERPEERERYKGVDEEWRKQHGAGPIEVYLGSEGPIEGEAVTAKYFHGKVRLFHSIIRHFADKSSAFRRTDSPTSTPAIPT